MAVRLKGDERESNVGKRINAFPITLGKSKDKSEKMRIEN